MLNSIQASAHQLGIASFADIILPITKMIQSSRREVKDAEKINDVWMRLNRVEGKPEVAYILMSQVALRNEEVVSEIINYISRLNCNILILKIKNLHLTDGAKDIRPRENMREILSSIARKKKSNSQLLTVCLECGQHLYLTYFVNDE